MSVFAAVGAAVSVAGLVMNATSGGSSGGSSGSGGNSANAAVTNSERNTQYTSNSSTYLNAASSMNKNNPNTPAPMWTPDEVNKTWANKIVQWSGMDQDNNDDS